MQVLENVSLKLHSTMRLGGSARYMCTITSEDDLLEALDFANQKQLPCRAIGGGSNIIWRDEGYHGILLVMKIVGHTRLSDGVSIQFGAGLEWDKAVEISVDSGLNGLEKLSLIPGSVGATPIQNVGAYGSEVRDTLRTVRAYDTEHHEFVELSNDECRFGYRTSRFKTVDAGRFIITSVTFTLSTDNPKPPYYESLEAYITDHGITAVTATTIRDAVIDIRTHKLPDPKVIANNGSFFANPTIDKDHYDALIEKNPTIKGWKQPDGSVKIAAGWLIEQAGFHDYHDSETGMATWRSQNLVIVNEHATTVKQLLSFRQKIIDAVNEKFQITLQQEPELLP